ncbi:MAG: hypothetical protein ACK42S_02600 [Caldimonas sp.]
MSLGALWGQVGTLGLSPTQRIICERPQIQSRRFRGERCEAAQRQADDVAAYNEVRGPFKEYKEHNTRSTYGTDGERHKKLHVPVAES